MDPKDEGGMLFDSNVYNSIVQGISRFISKFIAENTVIHQSVKNVTVVKRNKHLNIGDFQIPICQSKVSKETIGQINAELAKEIQSESEYVHSASLHPDGNIYVKLNRSAVYTRVLHEVLQRGGDYGKKGYDENNRETVLLNNSDLFHFEKSCEVCLESVRAAVVTEHVSQLLAANGHQIHFVKHTIPPAYEEEMKRYGLNVSHLKMDHENHTTEQNVHDYLDKLKSSQYMKTEIDHSGTRNHAGGLNDTVAQKTEKDVSRVPPLAQTQSQQVQQANENSCQNITDSNLNMYVDVLQYLKDHGFHIGKGGYEKGLTPTPVLLRGEISRKCSQCLNLQKSFEKSESATRCIHVVNKPRSFTQQQVDVLWKIISPDSIHQEHVICGSVLSTEKDPLTAKQFFNLRKVQMREAFVMKYGDQVAGDGWNTTINTMTEAVVKFELLSTVCKNPVKLELTQNSELGGPLDDKGGKFVMYNCARLSTLFQSFEEKVKQGIYQSLEGIETVDLSLLKEEEEWGLLFNYILYYPVLVEESIGSIGQTQSSIQTHRICSFLLNLSRDLSSYYRKVRILREPREHLQPAMFARLYLLKCLQQVIHNALCLLNIPPVLQM